MYYWSNFYLPAVEKDQRTSAFWRETYVDFSAAGLDFRLGAQNIVWGEVVGIFVADVVSARDQREFLLPSFDIIRKPQWAARAEYFKGDSHVEVIWIPFQTFDDIGKPGADFYPVRLPSPTSETVASAFLDPTTPAKTLANSAYGIRANTLVSGWDLAAFYYRSYDASPRSTVSPGRPRRSRSSSSRSTTTSGRWAGLRARISDHSSDAPSSSTRRAGTSPPPTRPHRKACLRAIPTIGS